MSSMGSCALLHSPKMVALYGRSGTSGRWSLRGGGRSLGGVPGGFIVYPHFCLLPDRESNVTSCFLLLLPSLPTINGCVPTKLWAKKTLPSSSCLFAPTYMVIASRASNSVCAYKASFESIHSCSGQGRAFCPTFMFLPFCSKVLSILSS